MSITAERVRELTRNVWMEEACQTPGDRPRVFDALMKPSKKPGGQHVISEGNHGRASLKPAFDEAVAALTQEFGAEQPPDDPITVYLAFAKLDLAHRTQLADLLMKERSNG